MNQPPFVGTWQPAGTAPYNKYILVSYKNGKVSVAHKTEHDIWSYVSDGQNPTHWMPLPDPPHPVEEWKEAWSKWITTPGNGYGGPSEEFRAGFEAGRKR